MAGPLRSRSNIPPKPMTAYERILLDIDPFIGFLRDTTVNVEEPMQINNLIKEFKKVKVTLTPNSMLRRYFTIHLAPHIWKMLEYSDEEKIKILFATSTPIAEEFMQMLSRNATIEVDIHNRITKYHSVTLKLEGLHKGSNGLMPFDEIKQEPDLFLPTLSPIKTPPISRLARFKSETDPLVDFVADRCRYIREPMKMVHLFREYKNIKGLSITDGTLRTYFRSKLAPTIWKSEEFEDDQKVQILFGTSTIVHDEYLEKLRQNATVEVDEHQRITKYESPTLNLNGKHAWICTPVKTEIPDDYEPPQASSPIIASPTSTSGSLPSLDNTVDMDSSEGTLMNVMGNFMTSISGFMQAQHMAMGGNGASSSAPTATPIAIKTIPTRQFLSHLLTCIFLIDSPILTRIHQDILNKLQNPETDVRIPVAQIKLAIQSIIAASLYQGHVAADGVVVSTTNAKKLMSLLQLFLTAHQEEDSEIRGFIESVDDQREIHVESVRIGLEMALMAIQ